MEERDCITVPPFPDIIWAIPLDYTADWELCDRSDWLIDAAGPPAVCHMTYVTRMPVLLVLMHTYAAVSAPLTQVNW